MGAHETLADVMKDSRKRFFTDAEFHAKVKRVVELVSEDCRQRTGEALMYTEEWAATAAAASALVMFASPE